jgi:hypothetical protein
MHFYDPFNRFVRLQDRWDTNTVVPNNLMLQKINTAFLFSGKINLVGNDFGAGFGDDNFAIAT